MKVIIREEGIVGLYKGYWVALATYGPYVGIYFSAYEQFKTFSSQLLHKTEQNLPFFVHISKKKKKKFFKQFQFLCVCIF